MTAADQGSLEPSWRSFGRAAGRSGPIEWRGLPYAFFMPAFILVVLISIFTLGFAIKESFFEVDNLGRGEYVGFENYTRLFVLDNGRANVWQSLIFVFGSLLVTIPLGIGLALLLNGPVPFRAAFRVLLIVPWLVSSLVTALLWTWALAGDFSPLSGPLATLGLRMPMAVTNPAFAMPALVLANA
jgi:ABC-type sugar transport system permease subunit